MSEQTLEAPSAPVTNSKQKSYFKKDKLNRFFLDDELSYIEHAPMDEGIFESYQDLTSRIKLDRQSEMTEVDMKLGETRKFLIEKLVRGWNLVDEDGESIPFAIQKVFELEPHVVGKLVEDIYKQNPILSGDDDEEGKKEASKS